MTTQTNAPWGLDRIDQRNRPISGTYSYTNTGSGVTAYVIDGLDGVLRVVTLLRGRGYRVRDLTVDVREGVVESRVSCTVVLTAADAHLLVLRLRRMPVVVSAELG